MRQKAKQGVFFKHLGLVAWNNSTRMQPAGRRHSSEDGPIEPPAVIGGRAGTEDEAVSVCGELVCAHRA